MNKMKRSFMQIKIIAVVILLLSACSQEDEYVTKGENETPSQRIEITVSTRDFVTDGTPDTRATDNGKETTFEDGDRVGIIILDKKNNLIYDNIPYKYINDNWTFDINNDDGKGGCYYDPKAYTYIVYYPYNKFVNGITTIGDLKRKLVPKIDQSTEEAYRVSDLMVWSFISDKPLEKLDIQLEHAFCSVSVTLDIDNYMLDDGENTLCDPFTPKFTEVNFTIDNNVYNAYQSANGSLLCILPPDFSTGDIRCFYTIASRTYGNTINIRNAKPATRYNSTTKIDAIYSLDNAKPGDFYCRKGSSSYLVPKNFAVLTNKHKEDCVGIVFKAGKDIEDNWKDSDIYKQKDGTLMGAIHGYALALHDGNSSNTLGWGSYGIQTYVNSAQYIIFCGYANTVIIKNNAISRKLSLEEAFPAAYHASEGYESQYPSPNNSSGWFLPSTGQCWYWHLVRETLLPSMKRVGGTEWNNKYWSSSERGLHSANHVWVMDFNNAYIFYDNKFGRHKVRPCLAF